MWIYDLRTNKHFTLKENPASCSRTSRTSSTAYKPDDRSERESRPSASDRFTYDELIRRDKASLDISWLRDASLEDTDNLPAPEVIAQELVEDLQAALVEFSAVAEQLASRAKGDAIAESARADPEAPRVG